MQVQLERLVSLASSPVAWTCPTVIILHRPLRRRLRARADSGLACLSNVPLRWLPPADGGQPRVLHFLIALIKICKETAVRAAFRCASPGAFLFHAMDGVRDVERFL